MRKSLLKEYVRLLIEQEVLQTQQVFQTKQKQPITFKMQPDSEPPNRGWVVDKLTAYVDGQEAGYLKMSYIPKENISKYYPNGVIDFLSEIEGKSSLWKFNEKPLIKQVDALIGVDSWHRPNDLEQKSEEELLQMKQELLVQINEKYNKRFKEFLKFKVDKPIVDYIDVDESQQRNRIGTALYIAGAQWLAKKGLKLYASTLQSNKAEGAWGFMKQYLSDHIGYETNTWYGKKIKRMFLSYL
jgi:GNAT superfamily N-acetyltransferase